MKKLMIIAPLLIMVACAKAPENIPAANIGEGTYRGASCSQLAERKQFYEAQLENLSAAQRNAQSADALGVFFLLLPVSSMSGNDRETEIAVTRGHLQEIDRERVRRNCT